MAGSPYPEAYTANLVAGMERTREEVKDAIADLMSKADIKDMPTARKLAARLHRTVASLTADLEG
jgi:CO dehydrogenase/acetyl-CoA synthase epsilon subunit